MPHAHKQNEAAEKRKRDNDRRDARKFINAQRRMAALRGHGSML